MKDHFLLLAILAVVAVLLFTGLGDQHLWQDEAETATLARTVISHGYPRGVDDRGNVINPTIRTGLGNDLGWRYHPWGQAYIAASSIAILGRTAFAARLPFAILGLLNILLTYLLALRLTRSRTTALLAALLTGTSVPFILLMRQCRYYAPAAFLTLSAIYCYQSYLDSAKRRYLWLAAASLAALGHTVHGMFIPLFAALGAHYLFFTERKRALEVISAALAAFLIVLPWFVYSNSGSHMTELTLDNIRKNFEFQIRMINKFIFPAVFFGCVYAVRSFLKKDMRLRLSWDEKRSGILLGLVAAATIAVISFAKERNFRYLVYFIPLSSIVTGAILSRLYPSRKALLSVFLLLWIFTDVFFSAKPRFFLPKFIYEVTHDYDGPVEGIIKFLKTNAREGDTVKITYGDIPVMFYTDLKVDNSKVFDNAHMPEWIVFRRWWDGAEFLNDPYFTEVAGTYKKHTLPYPDIPWENRPDDLGYHRFSTDREAPGIIVFEKAR